MNLKCIFQSGEEQRLILLQQINQPADSRSKHRRYANQQKETLVSIA